MPETSRNTPPTGATHPSATEAAPLQAPAPLLGTRIALLGAFPGMQALFAHFSARGLGIARYPTFEAFSAIPVAETPDAVVVGLRVGDAPGTDCLRHLTGHARYQDLPSLLVVENVSDALVESAFNQGASDVVSLPVQVVSIRRRLETLVDAARGRAQRQRATTMSCKHPDFEKALDRGEFELHYQPQVCLKSARCVAVEALLRWRHPEKGLLLPSAFIPVAEQSGQINLLGNWAIDQAAAFMARLRDGTWRSSIERISVNVSPRQLDQPGIVHTVESALARHGLDGTALELELTENALIRPTDDIRQTLDALKRLGARIALDDFGTGYSTFGYLKHFPVDVIKIDRSLVRDIVHRAGDKAIVRAIVSLARELELVSVAEGVEHLGELGVLRQMGCDAAQGNYVSRPLRAADFLNAYCAPTQAAANPVPQTSLRDLPTLPLLAARANAMTSASTPASPATQGQTLPPQQPAALQAIS